MRSVRPGERTLFLLFPDSDGFDLDQAALRQRRNLYAAARGQGIGSEVLRVNGVDRGEIVHIGKEDERLGDVSHAQAGFRKDRLDIFERELCLRGHVRTEQSGSRIHTQLARGVYDAPRVDALRIRADGGRRFSCFDLLDRKSVV